MAKTLLVCSLAALSGLVSYAQEFPRFAFNVGGGFTNPVESAGDRLDRGWNVNLGAGVNFHPNFALMVDTGYQMMGVNRTTLDTLGFPNGDVNIWSFTLNPVVHTNPRGPIDLYFTGGGGLYRWSQQFTQPSAADFVGFDPYFGFYQVTLPVDQVVSSYSVNKPGWNGGAGLAFGTRWNLQFYAEARFHRMILGNDRYVDSVPVTFGIRW